MRTWTSLDTTVARCGAGDKPKSDLIRTHTGLSCFWPDKADAISNLYAGTPALKGDFTRHSHREANKKRGAMNDGVYSLLRYYLNNFIDADRQEGMDLSDEESSFREPHSYKEEEQQRERCTIQTRRQYSRAGAKLAARRFTFSLKNEAQRSRSPTSLAAQEEHFDAESRSDFLLAVTSSAAAANTDALTNNGAIETLHNKLQSIDQRIFFDKALVGYVEMCFGRLFRR
jgi:hypothetical protein